MTDQCTYTGRYDRLSKAPTIIKRGTGGDAFDASCEATLAKAMQRDARDARNRLNYVLHGGGWVAEPSDDASPNKAEMDRRARHKRKTEALAAMKPGKEYTGRDLAERLGWPPKTIGSTLKALRLLGKVVSRTERMKNPLTGRMGEIQFWSRA
jgi:predicted Rossmann fold nucleotide-binding protein DprA/Smf involved in DNA uptake